MLWSTCPRNLNDFSSNIIYQTQSSPSMPHKLSYTIFIKHFLEKKIELEFSLYIDEKTQNILDFTVTSDEYSYENIYNKVLKIEKEHANDPAYAKQIWDKITNKQIIKTILTYYSELVTYHYENDINYEDTEDQQYLTNKLFAKTTFPYLGHRDNNNTHIQSIYIDIIVDEFIKTIIQQNMPCSPKNNQSQKSYTCISKYYTSFFEYTYNLKVSPGKASLVKTPEEETITYIRSWMQ